MAEAVVTGASGFIGSHLSERLLEEGFTVHGIDSFHPYYSPEVKRQNLEEVRNTAEESDGELEFVEGSILDDEDLERLPRDVDYVFHEAAIAGVRNSVENPEPYTEINVLGTVKLLDRFREVENFVAASSSSVYGNVPEEELPVEEERNLDPIAPYPLSKVQMEQVLELFEEVYGIPTVKLRYFSVYGPRQRPDEAFTKFISMALDGKPVTVYGDGEQSRDFTHVSDIVEGTLKAAENGQGVYNLGSGRRVTVNEMVEVLRKAMDVEVEKTYVEQPEGDARHTHADISKAREELGYEPGTGFEDGAESCVDWVRKMHEQGLL